MRVLELEEAKGSLSDYARKNRRDAVVVTRKGKPISALVPLDSRADLERLSLSTNPRFKAILDRSRADVNAGRVTSSAELRREFGLKRKAG